MRSFLLVVTSLLSFVAADVTQELLHFMATSDFEASDTTEDENEATAISTLGHYGHPPDGCEKDELAFRFSEIPGAVCAAKCTDFLPCPTDVPDGVTAVPMCALQDKQTGSKYCVLICQPSIGEESYLRGGDKQCGDATCQPVKGQGVGICTYAY